jgi:sporulation protein YlmC with PRC-barrel domain
MTSRKLPLIEVGYQVFTHDGGEEVGAVRQVVPNDRPEIVVYIENAGDFVIPLNAVTAVHSQKVIVDVSKLEQRVQVAIGRAHDAEKTRT